MKRSIVIAFWIALITAVLPARAHAQVSHNGIAWKHLPELMRKGYVSGVTDGTFDEMSLADAKGSGSVEQTWLKTQASLLVRAPKMLFPNTGLIFASWGNAVSV